MSFLNNIRRTYGSDIHNEMKKLLKLNKKWASWKNRIIFLVKCRENGVFPRHLTDTVRCVDALLTTKHPFHSYVERIKSGFIKKLLNVEISITSFELKEFEKTMKSLTVSLSSTLSSHDNNILKTFVEKDFRINFNKFKKSNMNKLSKLLAQRLIDFYNVQPGWLINKSNEKLPEEVINILSLGPKFSMVPREIPKLAIIKDLEQVISLVRFANEEEKDIFRAKCVNIVTNTMNNYTTIIRNNKIENVIYKDYETTKEFLKDHDGLTVLRADKGNSTVILNRSEYNRKMSDLLNDETVYKKINKDPTSKFQNISNKLVKKLESEQEISPIIAKKLIVHNSKSPKIYGLPKVHKMDTPLRPVVACLQTPSINLAKLIHNSLTDFTSSFTFKIQNSWELTNILKDFKVPDNYVMASFDVKSLFTNIPKDLVMEIITSEWPNIAENSNLDGSAMGNPSSPILAELVMNYILKKAVELLSFDLALLKIYVDDILIILPENDIKSTLDIFNSIHPKIQFTIEREKNKQLPFLDLELTRNDDNKIDVNWYRKAINANRCLNFRSFHSTSQKVGIVKQFKHKILTLSSNKFHKENFNIARNILLNNNYPIKLVNKIFNSTVDIQYSSTNPDNESPMIYSRFVNVPIIAGSIKGLLKDTNIKLALYNDFKVSKIFTSLKDKSDILMQSNVIYHIPCKDCDRCYIGQTKQYLKSRIQQHKLSVKEDKAGATGMTALAHHAFSTGHVFNFEEVKILDVEMNYHKRMSSEMVNIKMNKCVNFRTDTEGLSSIYSNIIAK